MNFAYSRTSSFVYNYVKMISFVTNSGLKIPVCGTFFRKYTRIYDHDFDFFHQNSAFSNSFFQMPLKSPEENSRSLEVENLIFKNGIANLTQDDTIKVMEYMANNIVINLKENATTLKFLDKKCSSFTNDMSLNELLYVFDIWYVLLGKKAFSTQYFNKTMDICFQNFELLNKNQLLQVIYYLGQYKAPKILFEKMSTVESKISQISDVEFAIICLSLFKLRVKSASNLILEKAVNVGKNLMLLEESFHLISILKFLRQLRYYNHELYDLLDQYIIQKSSSFIFVECSHFLATFSSQTIYRSCLFEVLENQGVTMLQKEISEFQESENSSHLHPSLRCRVKDVSRYLWALINVGHNIKQRTITTILSIVRKRYFLGEYEIQPPVLIDCLQSLAIVNVYPTDLLNYIFDKKVLTRLKIMKKDKPFHQLFFLCKSLEIECPDVKLNKHSYFKPIAQNLEDQIKKRPALSFVLSLIKEMSIEVKLCCSLPHIAILGIEGMWPCMKTDMTICKESSLFHIEVLDTEVCCRNSQQPIGFMAVKLRHLSKLNRTVIVLNQSDISILNELSSHHQVQELQKKILSNFGNLLKSKN